MLPVVVYPLDATAPSLPHPFEYRVERREWGAHTLSTNMNTTTGKGRCFGDAVLLETFAAWLADGESADARTGHALVLGCKVVSSTQWGEEGLLLVVSQLLARHERVTLVTALPPQEALAGVEVRSEEEWLSAASTASCSVACAVVLDLHGQSPLSASVVAAAAAACARGSGTLTIVERDVFNRWAALPSIERAAFGTRDAPPNCHRGGVTTLLPALVELPVLPASAWCVRGRALTDEGVRAAADSLHAALGRLDGPGGTRDPMDWATLFAAVHWRSLCNVLPSPAGGKTRASSDEERPPIARISRLLLPLALRVTEVTLSPQDHAEAGVGAPEPASSTPAAPRQGRAGARQGLGQVARSSMRKDGWQVGGNEWAALIARPVLPPALGEGEADPWFLHQRLGGNRAFYNRGLVAHCELLAAWRARPSGVVPRASDAVLPADLDYSAILEALATPDGDGQGAPPLPHSLPLAEIVDLLGDAWETHWTEQRDEDEGWD